MSTPATGGLHRVGGRYRSGVRVNWKKCGEEIIDEREVLQDGHVLCRPCSDG